MTSRPRVAAQHTFKHAAPTYSETTPVSYPGIDPNPAIRGRFPRQTHQSARNNPGLGIRVSGASSHDLSLTASGAKLTPLPVFGGGGGDVVADGTPGVFYLAGAGAGKLYRSVDWGGTWTQVTVSADDAANGLSEVGSPGGLAASGFPGEVAAWLPDGVFYSADYGVTWRHVSSSSIPYPAGGGSGAIFWGHAGSRSVLMVLSRGNEYVADMTAASPSFVKMTVPYAAAGLPIGVGDGVDEPWLATVDGSGRLSVYPLIAQATAPAPVTTETGWPAAPPPAGPGASPTAVVAIGGASSPGAPPSSVVDGTQHPGDGGEVDIVLKAPDAQSYPPPRGQTNPSGCHGGLSGAARVAPNTDGSYGAALVGNCWVQDSAGTLTFSGIVGSNQGTFGVIDAGYNATNVSAGTDAVIILAGGLFSRGDMKVAASQGGSPVAPADQTLVATSGTDPGSAGIATTGVTASAVNQTRFGPAGAAQVASAMNSGGVASDDGGASFKLATYDATLAVAWWRGATGSWLLYGLGLFSSAVPPDSNMVAGFQNWTSSTPPIGGHGNGGNVAGSSNTSLAVPTNGAVGALVGVPGQDTAFVGWGNLAGAARVRRVTVGPGPSFSHVTPIGAGVLTGAGGLAYCPTAGSAGSLKDVLLVIDGSSGGALYRVTDATSATPRVTRILDLAGGVSVTSQRFPISVDCASGTVLAATGNPADGLLKSTDGGQSYTKLPAIRPNEDIRAAAITPGNPFSMIVGDGDGYILSSNDGGQTWTVVNDPTTGENLAAAGALTGIWDLVAPPATARASADLSFSTPFGLRRLANGSDLVAGHGGEYQGKLTATGPAVTSFSLTNRRFAVTSKATAISAAKRKLKRGTTFRYTLAATSTATIVIEHKSTGRVVGGRCKRQTKRNAHKKHCTLLTRAGALRRKGHKGNNTLAFSGRIGHKALAPALYLATITARIGKGPTSRPRTATFTIVKR